MKKALCLLAVVAAACGGSRGANETSPGKLIATYIKALEQGNSKRAYAMLSKDVRKSLPFEAFDKQWRSHKRERELRAKALRDAREASPDLGTHAVVSFKDGKEVSLMRQEKAWRLERALVGGTVARTPRQAVRALTRAISSADFEKFVSILSRRKREALVRMLQSFAKSLAGNQDRHIQELSEHRAHMYWEDENGRYTVKLVLEDGDWRVDDFDIALRETDEDDEDGANQPTACTKGDPLCGL